MIRQRIDEQDGQVAALDPGARAAVQESFAGAAAEGAAAVQAATGSAGWKG